jgi:sulfoxide reductase heme-binding subunit YedZ
MSAFLPDQRQILVIKILAFIAALVPLLRLIWLAIHDGLGANPIQFIEHSTGTWALVMLLITLSVTPVRLIMGAHWLIQLRGMAGLWMFFYACLHLSAYLWLDFYFDWQEITLDIAKHPYVLAGVAAFLMTVPLAATSSKWAMRRLKRRWKQLHRLVYLIAVVAVLHFWWLVKKDITEPLIYAGVLTLLLGIRIFFMQYRKG